MIDATRDHLLQKRVRRVGLLGTLYTMELDFYKNKLFEQGIHVVTPERSARELLHHIIYDELCHGIVTSQSKKQVLKMIHQLAWEQELDGIILGCTELPLLISPSDVELPLFDSIEIHIDAILKRLN